MIIKSVNSPWLAIPWSSPAPVNSETEASRVMAWKKWENGGFRVKRMVENGEE